jgi:hypothetical protein
MPCLKGGQLMQRSVTPQCSGGRTTVAVTMSHSTRSLTRSLSLQATPMPEVSTGDNAVAGSEQASPAAPWLAGAARPPIRKAAKRWSRMPKEAKKKGVGRMEGKGRWVSTLNIAIILLFSELGFAAALLSGSREDCSRPAPSGVGF